MAIVNLAFMPGQPGFVGIEPNPFWAVILLMVARYGFRAGLFSALICAGAYFGLLSARVRDQVIGYRDLLSWNYAKPAILFVAVGVVVGMLVQRHSDRVRRLQQENEALTLENQKLRRGEEELRDVNVELANRVVGATETLPILYRYAKKLNDLDINQIYTALTDLVVEVIRATSCAVYERVGGRTSNVLQHSLNGQRSAARPELALEAALSESLFSKRQVLSLHDLLGMGIHRRDLYLCGPLSAGASGEVMALLVVHEIEFLRYNPATLRLFRVIVDWACASLEKATQYRAQPEALRMAQAKASVLRAQSISLAPGAMAAVAAAGSFDDEPTDRQAPATVSHEPLAPVGTGDDTSLSRVLSEANQRLFGDVAGPCLTSLPLPSSLRSDTHPHALLPAGVQLTPPAAVVATGPSLAELQALMTGELRIASSQGSPLAKLLAEIDGYLSKHGREGGR